MASQGEVKRYMQREIEDHVDYVCLEVNATGLAEDAAAHFDLYEDEVNYEIPEWVFDVARQVAEVWEKRAQQELDAEQG